MDTPLLCVADDRTFWPLLRWPEFQALPQRGDTVVVIPVVGLADWGLGLPYDLEEMLLSGVLKEASANHGDFPLLVLPPLRFVTGPAASCAFAVSPPVACALIAETVLAVKASGFTKVVLLNSSPWNEELCDAAARDLRIDHGVQMFCIAMSGLGLDLHPVRSRDRRTVTALFTALTGITPDPPAPPSPEDPRPQECDAAFRDAAARLAARLREVFERAPLPNGGALGPVPLP